MLTHLTVGSSDINKSRRFYDAALGALGIPQSDPAMPVAVYRREEGPALVVTKPLNGEAATHGNGSTLGFQAASAAEVEAFHAAGLANGGTCEGLPGVRPNAPGRAYLAYLRDPDGNKICAMAPNPEA